MCFGCMFIIIVRCEMEYLYLIPSMVIFMQTEEILSILTWREGERKAKHSMLERMF